MRAERITVRPFDQLRVLEYQGYQEINEHSTLYLTGEIPFKHQQEYLEWAKLEIWIEVMAESEEATECLFAGVIEALKMKVLNGVCVMELQLRSGTFLMDYDKKIRSFQDITLTYGDLLDTCNRSYEQCGKLMTVAEETPIGQFVMQYQETDWELIKRLASQNHTVVVPASNLKGVKYYFGIPERRGNLVINACEYETEYHIKEFSHNYSGNLDDGYIQDCLFYCWEDREIYQLGEWTIQEGQHLFVWRIESILKGGELYHTYWVRLRDQFAVPRQVNPAVSGNSLFGVVTAVKEEKVQVELIRDENKSESGKRWFPFATVYSSEDGTGWYCMPEPGDRIRLYFPNTEDSEAYIVSTYHEPDAKLRCNPEIKFWRNRDGKEIQLSPQQILLTNQKGTYVRLSDEGGIEIVSQGSISIRAKEHLNISSSNSSIALTAPEKIRLKQGTTEMDLGGDLNLQGARIKI